MSRRGLLALISLFSAPVGAHATCPTNPSTGTECVAYGAEKSITPPGQACRKIRNLDSTRQHVFVPVSSGAEWSAFLSYLPSGVTASSCMICSPGQAQGCGSIANGYGTQYCNGDGLSWGACNYSCNAGFEMRNGTCQRPMVCSPYSTQYCSGMANATCTQQCSGDGMYWGGCGNCTCNAPYQMVNGQCVLRTWQLASDPMSCLTRYGKALPTCPAGVGQACSEAGACCISGSDSSSCSQWGCKGTGGSMSINSCQ